MSLSDQAKDRQTYDSLWMLYQAEKQAVKRLTIKLAAAEKDAEWQPVKTAPKESKAVLVWCPERKNTYAVWWSSAEGWRYFGGFGHLLEEPTHWKPLPAPPDADIAAQEPNK